MNYHPLAVAGVIGAVFAVPLMALWVLGFDLLGGGGILMALMGGGMVFLLVGTFVLIVLWVVETIRGRG